MSKFPYLLTTSCLQRLSPGFSRMQNHPSIINMAVNPTVIFLCPSQAFVLPVASATGLVSQSPLFVRCPGVSMSGLTCLSSLWVIIITIMPLSLNPLLPCWADPTLLIHLLTMVIASLVYVLPSMGNNSHLLKNLICAFKALIYWKRGIFWALVVHWSNILFFQCQASPSVSGLGLETVQVFQSIALSEK